MYPHVPVPFTDLRPYVGIVKDEQWSECNLQGGADIILLHSTSFCFSCRLILSPWPTLCSVKPWSAGDLVTHLLHFSPHFPPHLVSLYCFFYQLMLCHLHIVLHFFHLSCTYSSSPSGRHSLSFFWPVVPISVLCSFTMRLCLYFPFCIYFFFFFFSPVVLSDVSYEQGLKVN